MANTQCGVCRTAAGCLAALCFFVFLTFLGAFLLHITEEPPELQQRRAVSDVDEKPLQWSFWSSLSYCLTVYTTIGPLQHPATDKGKVITVALAVVSVPSLLFTLHMCGKTLANILISLNAGCQNGCSSPGWKKLALELDGERRTYRTTFADAGAYSFPTWILLVELLMYLLIAPIFVLIKDEALERSQRESYASDVDEAQRSIRNYQDALWYFLCACMTIGFGGKAPTSRSAGLLVDTLLVFIAYLMLSTLCHVINLKLNAIHHHLKSDIDERYLQSQIRGKSAEMATGTADIRQSLRALVSRLPLSNRFWFLFLNYSQHESLLEHWRSKAQLRSTITQTDESLFARPRLRDPLRPIEKDRKSRDDVNSLMAMTDFRLHSVV